MPTIKGHPWFYRLVPSQTKTSLLDHHPIETIAGKLVVCLDTERGRRYGLFESPSQFLAYQGLFKPEERCFYEVVIGRYAQKPHFDLDIPSQSPSDQPIDHEHYKDRLIDRIIEVMAQFQIEVDLERDLLVFSSHAQGTGGKKSYHIVVDNYRHPNNEEAKMFYKRVVAELPEPIRQRVDMAVYSPHQQFRVLGSRKLHSDRVKILETTWSYHGRTIQHDWSGPCPSCPRDAKDDFQIMRACLVSQVEGCAELPSFMPCQDEEATNPILKSNHRHDPIMDEDLDLELARTAMEMLANLGGITVDSPRFPYRFHQTMGSLVLLKRVQPSLCRICHRVHEHENPYLMVTESNGQLREVRFYCRRAEPGKYLPVGVIPDYQGLAELLDAVREARDNRPASTEPASTELEPNYEMSSSTEILASMNRIGSRPRPKTSSKKKVSTEDRALQKFRRGQKLEEEKRSVLVQVRPRLQLRS